MNLPVLFEDEQILVVDKPAGILVHDGNGRDSKTIVDQIAGKVHDPDPVRPGIVHRLDKDTSGVLLIAKDVATKQFLQSQFRQRKVHKTYLAAVTGILKHKKARIEWPVGRNAKNPLKRAVRPTGRSALTEYEVLEEKDLRSLLKVQIHTGRTHQIRVHMKHLGHPILGDQLYGKKTPGLSRHFLHASKLDFTHPNGKQMSVTSELPSDLYNFWYNTSK